jgi:DNA end-binding protein Ku
LHHAAAIQQPSAFVKDLPHVGPADKTARLAEELIENWTDEKFDFSHHVDRYGREVHKLIEAKIHGRDIVAPEEKEEEPAVYNLMDALRKSMEHNRTTAQKHGSKTGTNGKSHPHGSARSRGSRRGHRRAS